MRSEQDDRADWLSTYCFCFVQYSHSTSIACFYQLQSFLGLHRSQKSFLYTRTRIWSNLAKLRDCQGLIHYSLAAALTPCLLARSFLVSVPVQSSRQTYPSLWVISYWILSLSVILPSQLGHLLRRFLHQHLNHCFDLSSILNLSCYCHHSVLEALFVSRKERFYRRFFWLYHSRADFRKDRTRV